MTTRDTDPALELDALLDPARLAVAWQVARARAPVTRASDEPASAGQDPAEPALAAPSSVEAGERGAPDAPGAPGAAIQRAVRAPAPRVLPPLPVAAAHRALLEEVDRMLAAIRIPAAARRGLGVRLDQLAAVLDPLDATAAEAALDDLEDLLQALVSAAGWPASGEEQPDG